MRVLGYARAARALVVLSVAGTLVLSGSSQAATGAGSQSLYWWAAQVSSNGRALTVVFDSTCSTGAPHALVAENAAAITIELVGSQGPCASAPSLGQLSVPLAHAVEGRAIVGSKPDPKLPGGSPARDVAGAAGGKPRTPRVIGMNAMDAKVALRMAGLKPHAKTASLSAVVVRERAAGAGKVVLTTARRPHLNIPSSGKSSTLGASASSPGSGASAATPAPSTGAPSVPATCPNANLAPTSNNLPQVEAAAICLVNQQRVQAGLVPLKQESHLQQAADQHSTDEVVNNYFSHTTPSGQTFSDRILATGYVPSGSGCDLGENLAWGTTNESSPAAIVTGWMNSAEHRANILNPDFRDTGMGIVASVPSSVSQSPGATYTQDFGVVD